MNRWPPFLPHPAILFVGIAWGFNFVVLQVAFKEFTPGGMGFIRFLLMVPLMFLVAKLLKQEVKIPKKARLKVLLSGLLSSGIYMVFFLEGSSRVSPAQGAILMATVPIWVSVLAIIFRQERFRWGVVLAIAFAYFGTTLVLTGGGKAVEGTVIGSVIVLISALIWAVSILVVNPLLSDLPAYGTYAYALPAAGLALIPYGIGPVSQLDLSSISPLGWAAMAYLVFVSGIASFVLYLVAVKSVGPSQASVIQYLVPVVAATAQWLVMGRPLVFVQVIGIAVVLIGVILVKKASSAPKAVQLAEENG